MSSRYAPGAALLVLLALVPTVLHNYVGYRRPDARRAEAIPTDLSGWSSVPVADATWSKPQFSSDDAFEREYRSGIGTPVRLVVIRSYDAKGLYHHPELAVAYGKSLVASGTVSIAALPDVPVFAMRSERSESPAYAVYALHAGDGFMRDPLPFQLRQSAALLVGGRRLTTLFFARGTGPGPEKLDESDAAQVLAAAIRAFLDQAGGA
jgi:hypothetical protein